MQIPVFCSLIPADLIVELGFKPHFINADECFTGRPQKGHCVFHENLCSYSKTLYDFLSAHQEEYELIIVPTACDALKKLYNALIADLPRHKVHLLDIPQIKNEVAQAYLAKEFLKLTDRLKIIRATAPNSASGAKTEETFIADDEPKIGIIGSNVPLKTVKNRLSALGFQLLFINHCIEKARPDKTLRSALEQNGIREYARLFMEKNSCPRTNDDQYRIRLLNLIREQKLKGLIVNSFKFCDFHPFDYKFFKRVCSPDFPILLIEHDLTADTEGQTMTRIDAFLENISGLIKAKHAHSAKAGGLFVGIDSGSHATKLVCIDKEGKIVARKIIPTGTSVKKSAKALIENLKQEQAAAGKDIKCIVATGYGRNEIDGVNQVVTEITCHATGAYRTLHKAITLIDVGGQDSKAIKIAPDGRVARFAMNDKCAAGTGRFLEVMSAKLEMSLEEFAELACNASSYVPISNMCSVFAESEVISLIAAGKSKEEISKGIHRSIAERTVSLMMRVEGGPPYYMAGGGAKNRGLIKELQECLGAKVEILTEPQFSGALGAAILASRSS